MRCPTCNAHVRNANRFCPYCGHNIEKSKIPAEGYRAAPPTASDEPVAPQKSTNQVLWVILGIGILLLAGMITLLALLPKVQG